MSHYHLLLTDRQTGHRLNLHLEHTVDDDGFDDFQAGVDEFGGNDEVRLYLALNEALAGNKGACTTDVHIVEPTTGGTRTEIEDLRETIEDVLIGRIVEMEFDNPNLEGILQELVESIA